MRIQISASIICLLLLLPYQSALAEEPVMPSFDCQQAQGQVEELICQDSHLASLDVEINEMFTKLKSQTSNDELSQLKAFQRGWIKGRNDCWKAENIKSCVQDSYESRLTELQIAAGEFEIPEPIQYLCGETANGNLTKITAYFYNDTAIPAAMLTVSPKSQYLKTTNFALLTRTASGAKYQGQNFSFWTHQGEAIFSQFEQADLNCITHE
ncbi:MliC family protein [Shewanella sp. 10N.286.52.A9]|uniref:MliC family protein n=1 Tax=Shewanella sp. 10N.286.52.A9 TaxID=3229711 RepID=UPI0035527C2B